MSTRVSYNHQPATYSYCPVKTRGVCVEALRHTAVTVHTQTAAEMKNINGNNLDSFIMIIFLGDVSVFSIIIRKPSTGLLQSASWQLVIQIENRFLLCHQILAI